LPPAIGLEEKAIQTANGKEQMAKLAFSAQRSAQSPMIDPGILDSVPPIC
jgi:hypothetical protein